ncbi:uncharacterized protein BHQ10_005468 [Talaromyces amestolkiae]|uniref:NAD(P)-binding domain-containing protein n=1 Tax=Talaromyces amestolkiae TaxID=1196081 RepID=A0A364L0Y7_TALAM|nr:uncharacterized protein BHQ10_005468 [Talaromyces amestolkiae]RAO69456.1 hypothetical protein BHQ10_005468 [Talaromyces amestolkiae]
MAIIVGVAGITGKFANLVVENLLQQPNVTVRGFCRNASKLPPSFQTSQRIDVIQGDSKDLKALRSFVKGTDVIICCYLGDDELMTNGQKLLVDACDLEGVRRYIASDYCLDFTKLEYGQLPAKDPMKIVKEYIETKQTLEGVHVLIGIFMETFWSKYFDVWNPDEYKFSFYGSGDELWESTTYGTAAEYVAAVALDGNAVGEQHFLGDRKSIRQIAAICEEVYGRKIHLERLGTLDDLYDSMQQSYRENRSNIYAYLAKFYQYYCQSGQTYLKKDLDNAKYPSVKPVTFEDFLHSHKLEDLADTYQNAGKRD